MNVLHTEGVSVGNPTLAMDAKVGFLCLRTKQGWEYMICDDCQIAFKEEVSRSKDDRKWRAKCLVLPSTFCKADYGIFQGNPLQEFCLSYDWFTGAQEEHIYCKQSSYIVYGVGGG